MNIEDLKKMSILVVEDVHSHREVIGGILKNIGCEVVISFNGKDVFSFIKRNSFDVILMDINMPDLNGIDTAKKIIEMQKEGYISNSISIIAITSDYDKLTEQDCIEAGMIGLIPKSLWQPRWEPKIKEKLLECLCKRIKP